MQLLLMITKPETAPMVRDNDGWRFHGVPGQNQLNSLQRFAGSNLKSQPIRIIVAPGRDGQKHGDSLTKMENHDAFSRWSIQPSFPPGANPFQRTHYQVAERCGFITHFAVSQNSVTTYIQYTFYSPYPEWWELFTLSIVTDGILSTICLGLGNRGPKSQ
jgi:hypothetical protein